jgi:hypothetical protein
MRESALASLSLVLKYGCKARERTDDADEGGKQWEPELRYPEGFDFETARLFCGNEGSKMCSSAR